MIEINPMYYGTLAFLAFSTCAFIIPGLIMIHGLKKEAKKKRPIGFVASGPESRQPK